jgi:hypothetical protein
MFVVHAGGAACSEYEQYSGEGRSTHAMLLMSEGRFVCFFVCNRKNCKTCSRNGTKGTSFGMS